MTSSQYYPVVVVGGGPAGAASAIVLARSGVRVSMVESGSSDTARIGEALPPACRPMLSDLGLLETVLRDCHLPCYGNVCVWGSDTPQITDFIADPNGCGWHIDRARFDRALRQAAADAGADVRHGISFQTARRLPCGRWRIAITDQKRRDEEIDCDWLIDASGRRSLLARIASVARVRTDRLIAMISRFRPTNSPSDDRDARTIVESTPDGWWYTVLVPGGERVVAYLTDTDLVDAASLLDAKRRNGSVKCAGRSLMFSASQYSV